jgi:hypothetical protein
MRGKRRCYFHARTFKPRRRDYSIPFIEDEHSLHVALLQLARAAAEDGVTPEAARLMMMGIQLSAANLRQMQRELQMQREREERDESRC